MRVIRFTSTVKPLILHLTLKLAPINNVNLKKRPSVGFFTDAGLFIMDHYTLAHFPFVNAFEMCTLYRGVQT